MAAGSLINDGKKLITPPPRTAATRELIKMAQRTRSLARSLTPRANSIFCQCQNSLARSAEGAGRAMAPRDEGKRALRRFAFPLVKGVILREY